MAGTYTSGTATNFPGFSGNFYVVTSLYDDPYVPVIFDRLANGLRKCRAPIDLMLAWLHEILRPRPLDEKTSHRAEDIPSVACRRWGRRSIRHKSPLQNFRKAV